MEVQSGKFYRLRSNKGHKVKVEEVSGSRVVYSGSGALLPRSARLVDFIARFEKCP